MLVTALACVLVLGACWIVTLQLRDLVVELPHHIETIKAKMNDLTNPHEDGFVKPVVNAVQQLSTAFQQHLTTPPDQEVHEVRIHNDYPSTILGVAQPILEVVVGIILVLVLVVFMLVDREDLQYRLIRLVGPSERAERIRHFK